MLLLSLSRRLIIVVVIVLFFLFFPLRCGPPQRKQLGRPGVERVLEALNLPVVELDLLPEAGKLAVALGEAGGQLLRGL